MDNTPVTTGELLRRMQNGWEDFQAYLKTLTPEQLTKPTDAAGWRVQDHIIHLAVWEGGVEALLSGQSRQAFMGVDDTTWKSDWHADDFFSINDGIFRRNQQKSLEDVLMTFQNVHERMMKTVAGLSNTDLLRSYNSFDPTSQSTTPIWRLIAGDSFGHYEEHRPWIEAIVSAQ
jgi:hypothetical protein